jgi:hypothetical protein
MSERAPSFDDHDSSSTASCPTDCRTLSQDDGAARNLHTPVQTVPLSLTRILYPFEYWPQAKQEGVERQSFLSYHSSPYSPTGSKIIPLSVRSFRRFFVPVWSWLPFRRKG